MSDFKTVTTKIACLRKALERLDGAVYDVRDDIESLEGVLPRWGEVQDRINADADRLRQAKIQMKQSIAGHEMYKEIRRWIEALANGLELDPRSPRLFCDIVTEVTRLKNKEAK